MWPTANSRPETAVYAYSVEAIEPAAPLGATVPRRTSRGKSWVPSGMGAGQRESGCRSHAVAVAVEVVYGGGRCHYFGVTAAAVLATSSWGEHCQRRSSNVLLAAAGLVLMAVCRTVDAVAGYMSCGLMARKTLVVLLFATIAAAVILGLRIEGRCYSWYCEMARQRLW